MLTRRKLITACATGTAVVLAGCSGDGDGGGDDGSADGGSDDQTDDDGSGTGDDTSGDDGSADGGSDDQTDDGSNADDGGSDTDDDGGSDAGDDGGDDTGDDGGDDGTADQTFGQVASFPESYAMEATVESPEGTIDMSGRFYQGDLYWEYTLEGQQVEMYFVGEDTYFVLGNQCFEGSQRTAVDRGDVDPSEYESESSDIRGLEPVGTDTIDGDDVLVYETPSDAEVGQVTYYILEDSGYPRRIEAENGQWDFYSWNEANPIEPPDIDCRSQYGG
ncbi:MAG: hypothetical protein V5A55_12390 [Halovenus sp.]